MNEHDSLVSQALNNMSLNELANYFADLKLREKDFRKVLLNILNIDQTLSQYVQLSYIYRICQDELIKLR